MGLAPNEQTGSPMWEFLNQEYDYKQVQRGDICQATVVRVLPDSIIVDIGGKTEGIVPASDLEKLGPQAVAAIQVGDQMLAYILRSESQQEGEVLVSLSMARTLQDWQRAKELHESGEIFEAEVVGYNKGGLLVPFGQLQGFVPFSHLMNLGGRTRSGPPSERLAQMVGRKLWLKVMEVNRRQRRLILSEREAQRQWRARQKERLLTELKEGDIVHGRITHLSDFGAFVDLGGADGLVHLSEMSWDRGRHPRDLLRIGQEVDAYVLRVDADKKRIGLSLKKLRPDPWSQIESKYQVGQLVEGTITNVVDFGAFAWLEEGIEGLIHVSELADKRVGHPQEVVQQGDVMTVQVLSLDATRRRVGLSFKRVPPELRKIERARLPEVPLEAPEAVEPEAVPEAPEAIEAEPAPEAPAAQEMADSRLQIADSRLQIRDSNLQSAI
jgi:small subunit ribosomal protein S1